MVLAITEKSRNISFGLYAAEDIVSASGTVIFPADGLIEIVSVNENGTAVMKGQTFRLANTMSKRLQPMSIMFSSDTKYQVVFEYAGQDAATVEIKVNDGKGIKNELIYGSVSGKKIDENGEALEGAVIRYLQSRRNRIYKGYCTYDDYL